MVYRADKYTPEERGYYTTREFAAREHVCNETVRRWLRAGALDAQRIRRTWHISLNATAPENLS